jgi:hypothetical protein
MNQQGVDALHQALVRIGFTNLAANEIVDQGLQDASALFLLTENDVKQMCKIVRDGGVVIPFMAQQRLQAFRFWANKRSRLGETVDADMFTLAVAKLYGQKMIAEGAEKETEVEVKAPDKFTASSKWFVFKEGFETYLTSQHGRGNIPLSYVIRPLDVFDPNEIFETDHERIIKSVPLIGPDYVEDNGMVYDLLKGLMLAGPAWPWMQQYDRKRDGRGAWKALMAHYEGSSAINRNKEAAYSSI